MTKKNELPTEEELTKTFGENSVETIKEEKPVIVEENKIEQLDWDNLDWDSMDVFSVEKNLDYSQAQGEGKLYPITIYSFNSEKKETGFSKQTREKNPKAEAKYCNFAVAKIDGKLMKWYASESQSRAILSSGLEPQMLPIQGQICTWVGTSSHPSVNLKFEGLHPKPKRELDDLLLEYKTKRYGSEEPEEVKKLWEAINEMKERITVLENK